MDYKDLQVRGDDTRRARGLQKESVARPVAGVPPAARAASGFDRVGRSLPLLTCPLHVTKIPAAS